MHGPTPSTGSPESGLCFDGYVPRVRIVLGHRSTARCARLRGVTRALHNEVWRSLGAQDPDWAVESAPGRKHGGWSGDLDLFYEIGRQRISEVLSAVPDVTFGAALDWGSGTGRLSFALAERFARVSCVDISDTMLATLQARASERSIDNLRRVLLPDFIGEGDHDLVVSLITLQHLPSREAVVDAIEKMVGGLRSGGYLYIDIPCRPHNLRYRLQPRLQVYRLLRRSGVAPHRLHRWGFSGISMLCVPKAWTINALETAGMVITELGETRFTTHQQVYYVARKK